ncbi:MAG: hypothetical protein M1820_009820 [Bogoriella megaspora]|nr:MAG: hypothetical protein M1820_009820 [Bogoriella megaspora]
MVWLYRLLQNKRDGTKRRAPEKKVELSPLVTPGTREHRKRERWRKVRSSLAIRSLLQIFTFLWIAPVIALLVLNFKRYIIGASAWCPFGQCQYHALADRETGSLNTNSLSELDHQDHNLLGALQFVGKAIEAWFVIVAGGLLFDVAMLLAQSQQGLPLGYILSILEFGDLTNLFNPHMYTPLHAQAKRTEQSRRSPVYIFAFLAILLTLLANLMGPSITVLLLPTQQWVPIVHLEDQAFQEMNSVNPPSGDFVFKGSCSASELALGHYGCTGDQYASNLNSMAVFADSSEKARCGPATSIDPLIQEAYLSFTFNSTSGTKVGKRGDRSVIWIPNRLVVRTSSNEWARFNNKENHDGDCGLDDFDHGSFSKLVREHRAVSNRSLSTLIERSGPTIGYFDQSSRMCNSGPVFDITGTSPNQTVRCLDRRVVYDSTSQYEYTQCFRIGQGWNVANQVQDFSLNAPSDQYPMQRNLSVQVYLSDKTTFFNSSTDFGSGMGKCYADSKQNNGTAAASCDWDKIFSTLMPPPLRNTTDNVLNVEYRAMLKDSTQGLENVVWCPTVAYAGFGTYSLDPSPATNPQRELSLKSLPDSTNNATLLAVNPSWLLASWSVDANGSTWNDRLIVSIMQSTIVDFQDHFDNIIANISYTNDNDTGIAVPINKGATEFEKFHSFAIFQALSMIDYNFTKPNPATSKVTDASSHPILGTSISVRVWTFGPYSRTWYLGVVVACLGILVTLSRSVIAIITSRKKAPSPSNIELMVAALEHKYQEEFEGRRFETDKARVRYRIEDHDGATRFFPQD